MKHYPPEFKADAVALYESRPEATIRSPAADRGVQIKGCCDDDSKCQHFTDEQVSTSHTQYNTWSTDSFECPSGTKK